MRVTNTLKYTLAERDIYGSKRIGADFTPVQLIGALPVSMIDTFGRYLGMKNYEMDNHLGNVLVTVSDRKIPISLDTTTGTAIDHYEADVLSSQDYYPFGMEEPGRNFNSTSYRFGFNAKLKDDDIYGAGNSYDYGVRMQDPRLGRWMSTDPLKSKYVSWSPYSYAINSPMKFIDGDGNDVTVYVKATPVATTTINLYTHADINDAKKKGITLIQKTFKVPVYEVDVTNESGDQAVFYFTRDGLMPGKGGVLKETTFNPNKDGETFKGNENKSKGNMKEFGVPVVLQILNNEGKNAGKDGISACQGSNDNEADHSFTGVLFHTIGATRACLMAVSQGTGNNIGQIESAYPDACVDLSNVGVTSAKSLNSFIKTIDNQLNNDKRCDFGHAINVKFDKVQDHCTEDENTNSNGTAAK